jgi:hypothetical protein
VAKTYQDIVTEVRVLLQDTDSDAPRYTDPVLLAILNRALQQLSVLRPDAYYGMFSANSLNVPEVVASGAIAGQVNISASFGLEMQFFSPLINYVVGVAEIIDDEYTEDGRAAMMLTQFRNSVLGL